MEEDHIATQVIYGSCSVCGTECGTGASPTHVCVRKLFCAAHCTVCAPPPQPEWSAEVTPVTGEQEGLF